MARPRHTEIPSAVGTFSYLCVELGGIKLKALDLNTLRRCRLPCHSALLGAIAAVFHAAVVRPDGREGGREAPPPKPHVVRNGSASATRTRSTPRWAPRCATARTASRRSTAASAPRSRRPSTSSGCSATCARGWPRSAGAQGGVHLRRRDDQPQDAGLRRGGHEHCYERRIEI